VALAAPEPALAAAPVSVAAAGEPEAVPPAPGAGPSAAAPAAGRESLLRHVVSMTAARGGAEALFMLRGLVLARLLGASAFGVWSAMRLVLLFGQYLQLGAREGMLQRVPFLRGRGEQRPADRLAAAAGALNHLAAVAGGVLVLAIAVPRATAVAPAGGPAGTVAAWTLFALTLAAAQLYWFAQSWQQAGGRFGELATATFVFAALSTGGGLAAGWRFGLPGFVAALAASYAAVAAGAALRRPRPPAPRLDRGAARELLACGSPILAGEALQVLLWNHDKVLVGIFAGSAALGVYSVPGYLTTALMLAPLALQNVLYPRLLEALGARGVAAAGPALEGAALVAARLAPLAIAPLVLLLEPVLGLALPGFEAAAAPGRVLVAASWLPMAAAVPAAVLVALGGQRRLMAIRFGAVAVGAAGAVVALQRQASLTAVALATTAGLAVYAVATAVASARAARFETPRRRRFLAALAAPGVVLAAALTAGFALPAPLAVRVLAATAVASLAVLAPRRRARAAASRS
jgi:O-antigen/teichoic acid export membrane protein